MRTEKMFFGRIRCVLSSDSNIRWLDLCICRMHRKWASCSRFVEVVLGWFRRSVGSQSGQGSRETRSPSVHGRMRFASSLRMSVWNFQEARMRCRFPKERVARNSQKCPYSFCISLSGNWLHMVFSFTLNVPVLETRSILLAVKYKSLYS